MAKVECLELAGKPCVFAFVGEVNFDENGIAEINHAELLELLAKQKNFRIIPDAPKSVKVVKPKETAKKVEPQTELKPEAAVEPKSE